MTTESESSVTYQYIAPAHRDDPAAARFDVYLERHCRWSPEDGREAGIAWLWDAPIPARLDWWNEVDRLNVSLSRIEKEQAERP